MSGDSNAIQPEGAKDPIVILVVALFLGGISYFVLGQWQKGLAAVALWLCAVVFVVITCGLGMLLFLPVTAAIVIDAYLQAKQLKSGSAIGQWTFFSAHL